MAHQLPAPSASTILPFLYSITTLCGRADALQAGHADGVARRRSGSCRPRRIARRRMAAAHRSALTSVGSTSVGAVAVGTCGRRSRRSRADQTSDAFVECYIRGIQTFELGRDRSIWPPICQRVASGASWRARRCATSSSVGIVARSGGGKAKGATVGSSYPASWRRHGQRAQLWIRCGARAAGTSTPPPQRKSTIDGRRVLTAMNQAAPAAPRRWTYCTLGGSGDGVAAAASDACRASDHAPWAAARSGVLLGASV